LADGTIYFGYQEGLAAINPLDKTSGQLRFQSSQVRFTEFFLNGKSIAQGKQTVLDRPVWQMSQLNLSHHQGNFSLRFSAFDFKKPESSQYEVRLLPFETEWRRVEGDPLVNYYQLPPGNYTLEVKGSDSNGIWAKETAKMDIHLAPPWWKSGWAYGLYMIIFAFGVLGVHRFQKARVIRKERERTKDRELAQAKEIEKAYEKLKSTQSQLIHSEKMASLGELTAGIAHEIQNPLNFVNNFSEVNKELIDELKEAQVKGHKDEIDAITKDILENEDKIMHHGKRAEAIVKSMLQHSRTSTGEKELTDINALADEYLRLAYHGFRAKDKSFNADFKTELADDLPRIEVVPQDIGRVLLNLINNAFQAVSAEALAKVGSDYKPTVTVSTSKKDEKVEIRVRDNGPGIPKNIKDKIFQPFFTTKPAGEGTGLGLSLSYDIVTKGHGGELKLETGEEMGTKFIILIPIK
jgi:signal transduction histidine kinase